MVTPHIHVQNLSPEACIVKDLVGWSEERSPTAVVSDTRHVGLRTSAPTYEEPGFATPSLCYNIGYFVVLDYWPVAANQVSLTGQQ